MLKTEALGYWYQQEVDYLFKMLIYLLKLEKCTLF